MGTLEDEIRTNNDEGNIELLRDLIADRQGKTNHTSQRFYDAAIQKTLDHLQKQFHEEPE